MAYVAVVSLKMNIEQVFIHLGPAFSPPSQKLLELAVKEFKSFQEFLQGLDGSSRKPMKDSLGLLIESISRFGGLLSSELSRQLQSRSGYDSGSLKMESLEQEFHVIFEMMSTIKQKRYRGNPGVRGNMSKRVILCDVYDKLKQDLVFELEKDETFFSVVGMAGIGKTKLAEAIFEDLDMMEWFECRAWVSVSKACRLEEIPRRILAQLDPDSSGELAEEDEDVRQYLKEILKDKRYLIVLDDVWDEGVRRHWKSFLPKSKKGSRVILTSRSRLVVKKAPCVNEVRLLNEKESWILLREKVFGGRSCPPELEEVGKKIAEKCDGLPLTIVTVGDLLSKIPESHWIDVATQRKHKVFVDAYNEISKVLYPSYEDLPLELKLCFLYLAVFPPNYKIARSRLINMWFVEELLGSDATEYLENCADDYLEEFSSNSLVMVYEKRISSSIATSIQKIKSCGLHSSWWHLCYTEARKNNFLYILISREDSLEGGIERQSRLSIHNNVLFAIKDVYESIEKNSASSARSLLCLGPYHRYPVPICFDLRFLQNLDALNIHLYEFPLEILKLFELKYFAITCDGELPASISELQNLQFFIVRRHHRIKHHGAPSYLPVEIWDMKELKHFQIIGSDLPDHRCDTILSNLSKLLDMSGHSCTKGILQRIPHLRKLGIRIELPLDSAEPLHCFEHISQLDQLKSFKCDVVNPTECKFVVVSIPTSLSVFPLGLTKLTLSGLGCTWEEMSSIDVLPCLTVLKLRCYAFQGPIWEVKENKFKKLRFLVIEDSNIMQWKVGRRCFKALKTISFKHCYKLKEVLLESKMTALQKIEVVDCNPSLENVMRGALLRFKKLVGIHVQSSWEEEDPKL